MKSAVSWILFAVFFFVAPNAARAQSEVGQTLVIESIELTRPERTLQKVRVRVRNVTDAPQSGVVWYVLASPSEPEPWRVHDYASTERAIRLRPGRTATIELSGPDTPLDGQFALSVWLHGTNPDTAARFHSDMRPHTETIVIAPTFSLAVDYFISPSQTDDADTMNILVRFSVRNNQQRAALMGLDYRITPRGQEPEPDLSQLARTVELAAGVDYVVTLRHPEPLSREPLTLTAWIYELVGDQLYYRGKNVTPIESRD